MSNKKEIQIKTIEFNNCYNLIFKKRSLHYTNEHRNSQTHTQITSVHTPLHCCSNPAIRPVLKQKKSDHKQQQGNLLNLVKTHHRNLQLQKLQQVSINGLNFQGFIQNKWLRRTQELHKRYKQSNLKPSIQSKGRTTGFTMNPSFSKLIDAQQQPNLAQFYNKLSVLAKHGEPNPQLLEKYDIKRRAITEDRESVLRSSLVVFKIKKERVIRGDMATASVRKRERYVRRREERGEREDAKGQSIEPWQMGGGQAGHLQLGFQ